LDSGGALVGIDGVEGWNEPAFGKEGVCGEFVACDFPDSDGFGEGVFFRVLRVLPVVDGGGCKFVVADVAFLVFRGGLGFRDLVHVWGEDSAVWIAEDSRVGHFVVDGSASVGGVSWLRPDDLFSLVTDASWEEDVGVFEFTFGDCGEVVWACHSCFFFRCCSLALDLFVTFSLCRCMFFFFFGGGGGGGGRMFLIRE